MRVFAVGLLTLAVLVSLVVCQFGGGYGYGGGGGGGGGWGNGGFLALIGMIFVILFLFSGNNNNQARNVHLLYGNFTDDDVRVGYTG